MAEAFVDELRGLLQDDPTTSQWLTSLESLLHVSYAQRFRVANNIPYFLVYDDAYSRGEKLLTVGEFYARSAAIAQECVQRGYYERVVTDIPTGG